MQFHILRNDLKPVLICCNCIPFRLQNNIFFSEGHTNFERLTSEEDERTELGMM